MRNVFSPQMSIGQIGIADIQIDVTSRDDIPVILLGLQHIYTTPPLRDAVFKILEEVAPIKMDKDEEKVVSINKGRPGMDQWSILVLGTLRLGLNADYDRILELANQHKTLREMLGLGCFDADKRYYLQTLKDNLKLFTPKVMARINVEVIQSGYRLLDLDVHAMIRGRCDSFVLKTDVHFPTDTNLLYDAIRTLIHVCAKWHAQHVLPGWRNHESNRRQFKRLYRKLQKLKHSTSKNEDKKAAKELEIKQAYQDYIDLAGCYFERTQTSIEVLKNGYKIPEILLADLHTFSQHAERQIDQIRRRAIQGETIPHAEKVFSLFQPHTEWISKGKAGVLVELGLRVCIMEDSHGFILHSQVMQKITDDKVAVPMVEATKAQFPRFNACSFDQGFHSPDNQKELKNHIDQVVLPKKGKLSKADQEREYAPEFMQAKRQHSAVESAINALEVHGLDNCPDHGIDAFERYVALAVLSRNIQKLGTIKRDAERQRRLIEKQKQAA
jgi:transposase, IS5 family